jgi:hypothetical protein
MCWLDDLRIPCSLSSHWVDPPPCIDQGGDQLQVSYLGRGRRVGVKWNDSPLVKILSCVDICHHVNPKPCSFNTAGEACR